MIPSESYQFLPNFSPPSHLGVLNPVGALHGVIFTPFSNMEQDECEDIANSFSSNLADLLEVPIFNFNTPAIEEMGYQGIQSGSLPVEPPYGPAEVNPTWGTTLVVNSLFRSRDWLSANQGPVFPDSVGSCHMKGFLMFNVNTIGTKEQAGKICKSLNNRTDIKARPVVLDDSGSVIISCEIVDPSTCTMYDVMEAVKEMAALQSVAVIGSHIVGSVTLSALMAAADAYIKRENVFLVKEQQKIRYVVDRLGLNSVSEFKADSKVVEYVLGVNRHGPLMTGSVHSFIESIGGMTSSPGGGSVAALVSTLAAALGQMTGWLTYGSKKGAGDAMRNILPALHKTVDKLTPLVDADAMAFSNYLAAQRLPQQSAEDVERREEALEEAVLTIVHVPLKIMEVASECWDSLDKLVTSHNPSLKADLQVAVKCLETGIWCAYKTVVFNIGDVKSEEVRSELNTKAKVLLDKKLVI
eukprot:sb/3464409/